MWALGASDNVDEVSRIATSIGHAVSTLEVTTERDVAWTEEYPASYLGVQTPAVQSAMPRCPSLVSTKDVLDRIASVGAAATLSELRGNLGQWNALIKEIAGGEAQWLEIAKAFAPVADGGSAEELSGSVAEALARSPREVLAILSAPHATEGQRSLSVDDVCGNYGVDWDPSAALSLLRAQSTAVASISEASLAETRTECLTLIRKSEERLAAAH
jgi:hypothetical protein